MLKSLFVGEAKTGTAQFIRSLFVSWISFALDFFICFLLVNKAGMHYVVATTISFTVGTILNYILNTLWIFRNGPVKSRKLEFAAFIILSAIGLGINSLCMYLFTGLIHIHYLISRVLSGTIGFVFNFWSRKYLLFSDSLLARRLSRRAGSRAGSPAGRNAGGADLGGGCSASGDSDSTDSCGAEPGSPETDSPECRS